MSELANKVPDLAMNQLKLHLLKFTLNDFEVINEQERFDQQFEENTHNYVVNKLHEVCDEHEVVDKLTAVASSLSKDGLKELLSLFETLLFNNNTGLQSLNIALLSQVKQTLPS